MRPIKFRAWDKQNKRWIVDFQVMPNGTIRRLKPTEDHPEGLEWQSVNGEDIDLVQYTGLKDKNGKEIYEGDVMKNYDYHFFVVEWNKKNARWDNCFGREVIGNIYENPELLEK